MGIRKAVSLVNEVMSQRGFLKVNTREVQAVVPNDMLKEYTNETFSPVRVATRVLRLRRSPYERIPEPDTESEDYYGS